MKTARYDDFSGSVVIDGRGVTVEVTREALEALYAKDFSAEEAVAKALKQSARLNRLARAIPADDGKIHITAELLMNDGRFAPANDEQTGA